MEGVPTNSKFLSTHDLLSLLERYDFSDFNSFVGENGIEDLKYTRLGVYSYDDDEESWHRPALIWCNIPNCNTKFESVYAYESHYNSLHRYLCSQCRKHLPSAHLLDLHLMERHDSFFAVQAEKKPMYSCYLEECTQKSSSPNERRDHCILEHKFPHDFRFDAYNYPKKTSKNPNAHVDSNENQNKKSSSPQTTNPSQRKPMNNFSFGHGQQKTFSKNDYAKKLTNNYKSKKKNNVLDDDKMVVDLLENLPKY